MKCLYFQFILILTDKTDRAVQAGIKHEDPPLLQPSFQLGGRMAVSVILTAGNQRKGRGGTIQKPIPRGGSAAVMGHLQDLASNRFLDRKSVV